MKFQFKLLFLLFLSLFGLNTAICQSKLLFKTDLEISYNDVDAWNKFEGLQNDNNDGFGFGLALNHQIKERIDVTLKYSTNNILYRDLDKRYTNSYYQIHIGYQLKLSEFTEFSPRIGFNVVNLNQYVSIQTKIQGRPETRNLVHYDRFDKEPFRHWSIGGQLKQTITESVYIGFNLDILYSVNFDLGRTILSPFLGFKLIN